MCILIFYRIISWVPLIGFFVCIIINTYRILLVYPPLYIHKYNQLPMTSLLLIYIRQSILLEHIFSSYLPNMYSMNSVTLEGFLISRTHVPDYYRQE